MTVRFVVPPSWRSVTDLPVLACDADTVGAALTWFADRYPPLRQRFLTEDNDIAPWALVCLGHVDVRSIGALQAPIRAEDQEIEIVSALMGG